MSNVQPQSITSILLKDGTTIADMDALIRGAQEAKRQARLAARKRPMPPFETVSVDYENVDDAGRPLVTIAFRPFVQPSVENGFGGLIVATSEINGRRYVPAGVLKDGEYDGKVLSVSWTARIENVEDKQATK